jgi:hypothetical protein
VVRETPSTGRQRFDHEDQATAVKGDTLRSRVNALLTRRRSSLKDFSFVLTAKRKNYKQLLSQGVKYATPSAMLLEELGLSPLQVFWWRRTLEFWNRLAGLRGTTLPEGL